MLQLLLPGPHAAGPIVPFPPGERALDALDDAWPGAGLPTACRAGNCGACLVAVVSGADALDPPDAHELQTLSTLCAAPDQRLGCQLRAASQLDPNSSPGATPRGNVVFRVIRR